MLWAIHITTALLSYASPAGEVATATALAAASTAAIHIAKIATVNGMLSTLKTAINTVIKKP